MKTRSDFWTDWQQMEADRRHLIKRLSNPDQVTRADITAARRQLEHCTPVPEFRGDRGAGCSGLTTDPAGPSLTTEEENTI